MRVTYAGYILGFPNDTPESIRRDIEIIQRELPIDMLEFFCLTPLPGSEDHQILYRKGVAMDPDMNKYDTEHAVTAHPQDDQGGMGGDLSRRLGHLLHARALETIMRRAGATGINLGPLAGTLLHFSQFTAMENVHPLQGGIFRLKFRRDRRPTLPIEPAWSFYPRFAWDLARKAVAVASAAIYLFGLKKRIKADFDRLAYRDAAITPVTEDETGTLDLFTNNEAARQAVAHERKVKELTAA